MESSSFAVGSSSKFTLRPTYDGLVRVSLLASRWAHREHLAPELSASNTHTHTHGKSLCTHGVSMLSDAECMLNDKNIIISLPRVGDALSNPDVVINVFLPNNRVVAGSYQLLPCTEYLQKNSAAAGPEICESPVCLNMTQCSSSARPSCVSHVGWNALCAPAKHLNGTLLHNGLCVGPNRARRMMIVTIS